MTGSVSSGTCVVKISASEACKSTSLYGKKYGKVYFNLWHAYFLNKSYVLLYFSCLIRVHLFTETNILKMGTYFCKVNLTACSRDRKVFFFLMDNQEKLIICSEQGMNPQKGMREFK